MDVATLARLVERIPLPDIATRRGIATLVARTDRRLRAAAVESEAAFAADMTAYPIAEETNAANRQHYEVPAEFFAQILGPHRKYSCCLYPSAGTTLAEAEAAALAETCLHASLANGQDVLELGCGWGSLSLWMAEHYPSSHITAVSNSHPQRAYIEAQADARGLANLRVVTADMNSFVPDTRYDRVVSVEMFEHMSNWTELLTRIRTWMKDDARLFLHVFSHDRAPYRFDKRDSADWIAQHFFTGGIMPSHGLIHMFPNVFVVEEEWRWAGSHYAQTARDWLRNFDGNIGVIRPILRDVYGKDASLWERRWRLFFLATEGLFGFENGTPWGVSHYRLKPAP